MRIQQSISTESLIVDSTRCVGSVNYFDNNTNRLSLTYSDARKMYVIRLQLQSHFCPDTHPLLVALAFSGFLYICSKRILTAMAVPNSR